MDTGIISITAVIWAVFAGIILAVIYTALQKTAFGNFFNLLIKSNSFDDKTAKTLSQLEITSKIHTAIIFSGLKSQYGLRRVTGFVLPDGSVCNFDSKMTHIIDQNTKFFTDKEKADETLKKYTPKKSNPLYISLLIAALAIIAALATRIVPMLSEFAFNTADSFNKNYSSTHDATNDNSQENTNEDNNNTPIVPEIIYPQDTPDTTEDNSDDSQDNSNDEIKPTPSAPTIPTPSKTPSPTIHSPSIPKPPINQ